MKSRKRRIVEIHPEVLAALFGVHLRTIWRWARKHKLTIKAVKENLYLWKNSCYQYEAIEDLHVFPFTVVSWKKKGILQGYSTFGVVRIDLRSIQLVKNHANYKRRGKRVLFTKNFSVKQFQQRFARLPEKVSREEIDAIIELETKKFIHIQNRRYMTGIEKLRVTRRNKKKQSRLERLREIGLRHQVAPEKRKKNVASQIDPDEPTDLWSELKYEDRLRPNSIRR